jgi:hypothetical protein
MYGASDTHVSRPHAGFRAPSCGSVPTKRHGSEDRPAFTPYYELSASPNSTKIQAPSQLVLRDAVRSRGG